MKRTTRFAGGRPNATGLRTVVGNHVMDHCEPGLTCMNKDSGPAGVPSVGAVLMEIRSDKT